MKGYVYLASMALFGKTVWEICSDRIASAFLWGAGFALALGFFALLNWVEEERRMHDERRC